jgi:hypothetical protein
LSDQTFCVIPAPGFELARTGGRWFLQVGISIGRFLSLDGLQYNKLSKSNFIIGAKSMTPDNPYAIVIDDHLDQIREGIETLKALLKPTQAKKRCDIVRNLCQLTRDIMFTMRPIAQYDEDYVSKIVTVFEMASEAIPLEPKFEIVGKYKDRIRERSEELLNKLSQSGRSRTLVSFNRTSSLI